MTAKTKKKITEREGFGTNEYVVYPAHGVGQITAIEEQEIALRPGHFVHCPPGVNHVFVGGDRGPCAILMIGHRPEPNELCYPVSELAGRFGASAEAETHEPRQAYGPMERVETSGTWPLS